jgi:hypothetical protein
MTNDPCPIQCIHTQSYFALIAFPEYQHELSVWKYHLQEAFDSFRCDEVVLRSQQMVDTHAIQRMFGLYSCTFDVSTKVLSFSGLAGRVQSLREQGHLLSPQLRRMVVTCSSAKVPTDISSLLFAKQLTLRSGHSGVSLVEEICEKIRQTSFGESAFVSVCAAGVDQWTSEGGALLVLFGHESVVGRAHEMAAAELSLIASTLRQHDVQGVNALVASLPGFNEIVRRWSDTVVVANIADDLHNTCCVHGGVEGLSSSSVDPTSADLFIATTVVDATRDEVAPPLPRPAGEDNCDQHCPCPHSPPPCNALTVPILPDRQWFRQVPSSQTPACQLSSGGTKGFYAPFNFEQLLVIEEAYTAKCLTVTVHDTTHCDAPDSPETSSWVIDFRSMRASHTSSGETGRVVFRLMDLRTPPLLYDVARKQFHLRPHSHNCSEIHSECEAKASKHTENTECECDGNDRHQYAAPVASDDSPIISQSSHLNRHISLLSEHAQPLGQASLQLCGEEKSVKGALADMSEYISSVTGVLTLSLSTMQGRPGVSIEALLTSITDAVLFEVGGYGGVTAVSRGDSAEWSVVVCFIGDGAFRALIESMVYRTCANLLLSSIH